MIVLNSPKGWTGPKVVDGLQVEGTFRAHQVPLSDPATHPEHLKLLEGWLRSYRPEELFDESGRLKPELAELAPKGDRRMGANPHANGGRLLRDLRLPDFAIMGRCVHAGSARHRGRPCAWTFPARRGQTQQCATKLPRVRPGRNPLQRTGSSLPSDPTAVGGGDFAERRIPRARWTRSRRCSASINARAGLKVICSRDGMDFSTATKRSSTLLIRCSTSTRSG